MPKPTTNPKRLARTERDVAWNPLPGDRFRYPDGLTIICLSGNPSGLFSEAVFQKRLSEAPAGGTLLPYRATPLSPPSVEFVQGLLGRLRTNKVSGFPNLPSMVDRGIHNGQIRLDGVPLDYNADLPEAPFIYHAANVLHCMVKFGAPALVAENARDPRNNPQPGDVRISKSGCRWVWSQPAQDLSPDRIVAWQRQDGGTRWETAHPNYKPHDWADFQDFFKTGTARDNWNRHQEWQRRSLTHQKVHVTVSGRADDSKIVAEQMRDAVQRWSDASYSASDWAALRAWEQLAPFRSRQKPGAASAPAPRRCPRTDPRPGDLCVLPKSAVLPMCVEVYKEGASVWVWGVAASAETFWVRAEDVVRKPGASS